MFVEGDPNPRCSECKSTSFFEDHREGCITCRFCGLVVQDHLFVDDGYHIKTDNHGYSMNQHFGAPINPLLEKSSLSTMIGYGGKCSRILRNIHQQQSMPSRERSLYHKFKEINEALEMRLSISSDRVTRCAQNIWKDLKDKQVITKGEKNTAMVACCIYYACKLSNFKRTRKDIIEALGMGANGSKKFKQATTLILANLQDKPYFNQMIEDAITPDEYVVKMITRLEFLSGEALWTLVKEMRRLLVITEESEKLANLQTNTVLATLMCVAVHNANTHKCPGEIVTLEDISITYDVNLQTLKSKLKVLMTIPELQDSAALALHASKKRKHRHAALVECN